MRKLTVLVLALALAACCASALAETRITVTGSGEALVPADTAVVSLGVSVRESDALQAQAKANEKTAAIREALTGAGIPAEDINTGYINLYPVYDYSGEEEVIRGYRATSTLAVRVSDPAQAGRVVDLAFGAGANTLDGVSFSVEDDSGARADAMKAACADAREKAEILAEAYGLKITGIEEIREGGTVRFDREGGNFPAKVGGNADKGGGGTVVQAAKIGISAEVAVTFTVE